MSASIAVTGSVAYDHIMNFPGKFKDHILPDKLHILNVSFLVSNLQKLRGGCAANIAYACALLGLDAKLVAAVGSDFASYRAWLGERGVDLSGILEDKDLLTASCFITTDGDNNQITGFYPGAMARAKEATVGKLPGESPALAIVSPNDPEAMRAYPQECRDLGVAFFYDPGQQCIALSGDDLREGARGSAALVCNDYELALVQDKTKASLEDLLELTEAVVVTLGEKGSRIHVRGEEPLEVPAAHVEEVLDPTGAGDAFRGGLIKGYTSGAGWETAARLGALTAAFCVEQQGTTAYSFTMDEFNARFERAYGLASGLA